VRREIDAGQIVAVFIVTGSINRVGKTAGVSHSLARRLLVAEGLVSAARQPRGKAAAKRRFLELIESGWSMSRAAREIATHGRAPLGGHMMVRPGGADLSYDGDMTTTTAELPDLLAEINDATKLLQRSKTVPEQVIKMIDSFESALGATDPYLAAALWPAALRAQRALRHDNTEQRRRDVRIALEQFRQALRDIVDNQPYNEDAPIHDVLARTVETVAVPQKAVAELLGVSVRQLQRWLGPDGPDPSADDAARIRVVGQIVNQLRHSFTGPGAVAWFYRRHPVLKKPPIELLDDPLRYPEVLSAATAARAMTA
jgi:hypothetical protein